jgi:pimeloyl-ACP methyl ester carboxylesterase
MGSFRWLVLVTFLLCAVGAHAQEIPSGEVQRVTTREGVSVPIYTFWRNDAVATVVLFSGGSGGYGQIGADGWPTGGNFLIRTGKHWATYPFNIVMVGRTTDGIDLSLGNVRIGEKHAADNLAVFQAIKLRSPLPIWVVGTSMGTISATAAAIHDSESLVSGVVLTSSIVAYKVTGALPKQDLEKIHVPTLILHHADDACWACRPYEVKNIASALVNAPIKRTIMVSGGGGATGNPCEPMHHHGFVGMQDEVVDLIAAWIVKPTE